MRFFLYFIGVALVVVAIIPLLAVTLQITELLIEDLEKKVRERREERNDR